MKSIAWLTNAKCSIFSDSRKDEKMMMNDWWAVTKKSFLVFILMVHFFFMFPSCSLHVPRLCWLRTISLLIQCKLTYSSDFGNHNIFGFTLWKMYAAKEILRKNKQQQQKPLHKLNEMHCSKTCVLGKEQVIKISIMFNVH